MSPSPPLLYKETPISSHHITPLHSHTFHIDETSTSTNLTHLMPSRMEYVVRAGAYWARVLKSPGEAENTAPRHDLLHLGRDQKYIELKLPANTISHVNLHLSGAHGTNPLNLYIITSGDSLIALSLPLSLSQWQNIAAKMQHIALSQHLASQSGVTALIVPHRHTLVISHNDAQTLSIVSLRDESSSLQISQARRFSSKSVLNRLWPFSRRDTANGTVALAHLAGETASPRFVLALTTQGHVNVWDYETGALVQIHENIFGVQSSTDEPVTFTFNRDPLRIVRRDENSAYLVVHVKQSNEALEKFVCVLVENASNGDVNEARTNDADAKPLIFTQYQTVFGSATAEKSSASNATPQQRYQAHHLVDFLILDGFLWTIWNTMPSTNGGGEYAVKYRKLVPSRGEKSTARTPTLALQRNAAASWSEVHTLIDDLREFPGGDSDSEAYSLSLRSQIIERLSHFPVNVLHRADVIGNANNIAFNTDSINVEEIQRKILQHLEEDTSFLLRMEDQDENTDEESLQRSQLAVYWDQSAKCWLDDNSPLGFCFFDGHSLGLINMINSTVLRPMDVVESLYSHTTSSTTPLSTCSNALRYSFVHFLQDDATYAPLVNDRSILNDVLTLVDCVQLLSSHLERFQMAEFEEQLYDAESEPFQVAYRYLIGLSHGANPKHTRFMLDLQRKLYHVRKPAVAIQILLSLLERKTTLSEDQHADDGSMNDDDTPAPSPSLQALLANFDLTDDAYLISQICKQIIESRFEFVRDFAFFIFFLSMQKSHLGLHIQLRQQIEHEFLHEATALLKTYYVLLWTSKQLWTPPIYEMESDSFGFENLRISHEDDLKKTNFLSKFIVCRQSEIVNRFEVLALGHRSAQNGVLSLFDASRVHLLTYVALFTTDLLIVTDEEESSQIRALRTARILYHSRQFDVLRDYARFHLSQVPHMAHYLGICELRHENLAEAHDFFLEACTFVEEGPNKLVLELFRSFQRCSTSGVDVALLSTDMERICVAPMYEYFFELSKLCTKHPWLELQMARAALKYKDNAVLRPNAGGNENSVSTTTPSTTAPHTIMSVVFNDYLSLGMYESAYDTIMGNTNTTQRKADINLFVSTLCEKGRGQLLNKLSFVGISKEVEEALQLNAQYSDILHTKKYYATWYAFLLARHNYNGAAVVMCEYARRIAQESDATSRQHLLLQKQCYSRAIDALQHVEPVNRWLLSPTYEEEKRKVARTRKGKRPRGSLASFADLPQSPKNTFRDASPPNLVTLHDIRGLHLLAKAKLELFDHNQQEQKNSSVNLMNSSTLSAEDVYIWLVEACLFDTAFSVCQYFELDPELLFEKLAVKCANIATGSAAISFSYRTDDGSHTLHVDHPQTSRGWELIRTYLTHYEPTLDGYHYHTFVMSILLQHAPYMEFPQWLIDTLEERCPNDLLGSYLKYGLLRKAAELVSRVLAETPAYNVPSYYRFISARNLDRLHLSLTQVLSGAPLDQKTRETMQRAKSVVEGYVTRHGADAEEMSDDDDSSQ